jgi:hypothetical protein
MNLAPLAVQTNPNGTQATAELEVTLPAPKPGPFAFFLKGIGFSRNRHR